METAVGVFGCMRGLYGVKEIVSNLVVSEPSNREQLNKLLSYFEQYTKEINTTTSNIVSLSTYAHDERVIKGAISEMKMFTTPTMLPSYSKDVWGIKADELKRSISNYLNGINGTNHDGGDILRAIVDKAEGYAYKIGEAVQHYLTLIDGGFAAYLVYSIYGQLPHREMAKTEMIKQYDKAVERTMQYQREALTDFSTVAAKMKQIIKDDVKASDNAKKTWVNYRKIVTKMYDFLNDKYRHNDIPNAPNVRWLIIACENVNNPFGTGFAEIRNCTNHIYASYRRLAVWIFPFVDSETLPVCQSLTEEIDDIEKMIGRECLYFCKYKIVKVDRSLHKISKKILPTILQSDKYRSVVVQRKTVEAICNPGGSGTFHVVSLNDVIVVNPTSLPLYRKQMGYYEIFVF